MFQPNSRLTPDEPCSHLIDQDFRDGSRLLARGHDASVTLNHQKRPRAGKSWPCLFCDAESSVRIVVIEHIVPKDQGLLLLQEALSDEDGTIRAIAAFRLEHAASEER
jgi:hypothetical protein